MERQCVAAEEPEHLLLDCVGREAELFVEHLVGGGCAEVLHAVDISVGAHNLAERRRQSCRESECRLAGGDDTAAIVGVLVKEESYGGDGDNTRCHALGFEKHCDLAEKRHL